MTTDPGKPCAFARALRSGVTLSAVLAMKRIGCDVLPSKGPVYHVRNVRSSTKEKAELLTYQ